MTKEELATIQAAFDAHRRDVEQMVSYLRGKAWTLEQQSAMEERS
jgi:hypothetical protein